MKRQAGLTLVEVLVAATIIGVAAILIVPQINTVRKVVSNSADLDLCRAQVQRSFNILESGGIYTMSQPEFVGFEDSQPNHSLRPRPYRVPLTERVSYIAGNTRTFADRFNQFLGHTDLYRVKGANNSDYRRVSRAPGQGTTASESITTENDGIVSYLPLLMKGAVADLADLYIESRYRGAFAAAPSYLNPILNVPHVGAANMSLRVDRIERDTGAINTTSDKFWPIPMRGLALGKSNADNIVRDPDHILKLATLKESGINYGLGYRIVTFPYNGPDVYMSNRFGFRAHFKYKMNLSNGEQIECQSSKDYHLPSDQQVIGKPLVDFNFLKTDGTIYDTHILSDKFYPLDPAGGVNKADLSKICSGNCGSSRDMVIKEPKWLAIITNTNFGKNSSGKAMAKNGVDRPTCSQDNTETKTFTFILRFSNLGKDGASIPLCLDQSYKPSALQQYDHISPDGTAYASKRSAFKWGASSQKDSYIWCEGGNSNADVATGARTLIMNDFLPTQGGYVPCEQLRICGQIPNKVTVKNLANQAVEYQYQYEVRNSDNRVEKNRLWGCVPQFSTVVTDAVGNLMYGVLPIKYPNEAIVDSLPEDDQIGSTQGTVGIVSPNIYFKPPPCYACECKKCKKKKKWFAVLLGVALMFAGGFMAASLMQSMQVAINVATLLPSTAAALYGTGAVFAVNMAIGVVGVFAMAAISVCGLQMTGMTSGGSCSSWDKKADFNQFQSCSKDPSQPVCKCGSNCTKISPPAVRFANGEDKDLPPGVTDRSIYGYCGYEREMNRNTSGITWNVRKGARINPTLPGAYIDESATIDYSNPNADLVENAHYTPVGDVSEFFYVNKLSGFACYSADECYFDDADERPKWQIKKDVDYDQNASGSQVDINACGWFKVGYALTGSANSSEKSVIRLATPSSPSCIAPDIGNKLWGCEGSGIGNELKTRCYQANGELKMADLVDPPNELGGGVYAGTPTGRKAEPFTVTIATNNNTSITNKTYTFVEYRAPKCKEVDLPRSGPIPVSQPHGIDTAPVMGQRYTVDGQTYPVHESCTSYSISNFACPGFSCSLLGSSCVGSPVGFGSCTYNAPISAIAPSCTGSGGAICALIPGGCTKVNAGPGFCRYDPGRSAVAASCTRHVGLCKRRRLSYFDYWYGCNMPEDIEAHTLSSTNRGMVCFQNNYTTSQANLPFCGGGSSSGADDEVGASGTCSKLGGGACTQPMGNSQPGIGGGGFDGGG